MRFKMPIFLPDPTNHFIFRSNMGSDLGRIHTYSAPSVPDIRNKKIQTLELTNVTQTKSHNTNEHPTADSAFSTHQRESWRSRTTRTPRLL